MTDSGVSTDSIDVILIGASTRAAAMSARRAGLTPWCADLFADADLERIAVARRVPVDAYPECFLASLADAPRVPVIYTGALENSPNLIRRIDRPLWGNSATVLNAVRSPAHWTACLRACGIPHPLSTDRPTTVGRWLLKPRRSGSGVGIRAYTGQPFNPRTHFLQEWISGIPCSAIYLGQGDQAILLGITRQLVGTPWLNATGFHYAGNIELPLQALMEECWHNIGTALARSFRLRGLFGVDVILRNGEPWPIEINPRYTASVEVLERGLNLPLLALHREVFESNQRIAPTQCAARAGGNSNRWETIHGKAILYARESVTFPADGPWCGSTDYADIPHAGDLIEKGRPVLTLFASAATVDDCCLKLREKAQALDRALWG